MDCPHRKKHIAEHVISMSQLVEDLELYPWLLDVPELQELFAELKKFVDAARRFPK